VAVAEQFLIRYDPSNTNIYKPQRLTTDDKFTISFIPCVSHCDITRESGNLSILSNPSPRSVNHARLKLSRLGRQAQPTGELLRVATADRAHVLNSIWSQKLRVPLPLTLLINTPSLRNLLTPSRRFATILRVMAEVLTILGVAAAVAQLIHYMCFLVLHTLALSHKLRQALDRIQSWNDELSFMLSILDKICADPRESQTAIVRLAQPCRSELDAIRLLLPPFQFRPSPQKISRRGAALFLLRREDEIKARWASFQRKSAIMVLGSLM
jgi:hypothetical protein